MATNKENNIKLHKIITKFFNDTILKFKGYYTKTEADPYRTVKDLTHLTTRDEMYNAVEEGESYLCNIIGYQGIWTCINKQATSATLYGEGVNNAGRNGTWRTIVVPGNTSSFNLFPTPRTVSDPTADEHATTQKFVFTNFFAKNDYEEKEIMTRTIKTFNSLKPPASLPQEIIDNFQNIISASSTYFGDPYGSYAGFIESQNQEWRIATADGTLLPLELTPNGSINHPEKWEQLTIVYYIETKINVLVKK